MVVRYLFHRVRYILTRYVEFLEISAAKLWPNLKPELDVIILQWLEGANSKPSPRILFTGPTLRNNFRRTAAGLPSPGLHRHEQFHSGFPPSAAMSEWWRDPQASPGSDHQDEQYDPYNHSGNLAHSLLPQRPPPCPHELSRKVERGAF